jgi:hypothetical protein
VASGGGVRAVLGLLLVLVGARCTWLSPGAQCLAFTFAVCILPELPVTLLS